VQSEAYAQQLATLDLTDPVARMKEVNEKFNLLFNERLMEMFARHIRSKIVVVRREMDVAYRVVTMALPVLYLTETDAEKRELIARAMEQIDALVIQLRKTLAHHRTKQADNEGQDEGLLNP
jgi:hypothetical protein